MVYMNIHDLTNDMQDLRTSSTFPVYNHLFLYTGSPKSICSEDWPQRANWNALRLLRSPHQLGHCASLDNIPNLFMLHASSVKSMKAMETPSSSAKLTSSFLLLQSPFHLTPYCPEPSIQYQHPQIEQ